MRITTYAGRLERLFANLLDTIFLLLPNGLIVSILGNHGYSTAITFLVVMGYYMYFTASSWQATPGKRLLGIYVIRTDGRLLNLRDTLERFLAYSIPSLPIYSSLLSEDLMSALVMGLSLFWFAPILFTEERIGYHDQLCHTRVVVGKR